MGCRRPPEPEGRARRVPGPGPRRRAIHPHPRSLAPSSWPGLIPRGRGQAFTGPPDLLIRFVETGIVEAVITHNRYILLNHTAEPLIDVATRRGLGVVNAAAYGSGILEQTYRI
jgi:hypothetical protein